MGKVIAGFAMSLDGFIADSEDGVGLLYRWFTHGDTPFPVMGRVFMTSAVSAEHYQELLAATGAHVTGRRDFDISRAWGGKHPLGMPVFIVTHTIPQEWATEESPFAFVTEGVARAIKKAKKAAGDKNILVGGSLIVQQSIRAGLLDEIHIDLVPILLGTGVRLFDHLGIDPIALEKIKVLDAPGVTHLRYRIVEKQNRS